MNGETRSISDRVRGVAAEVLAIEPAEVREDVAIRDQLAADSLDRLSLFMALEDEFGATIPEHDIESLRTLGDVVDYIVERRDAINHP